ncbi:histidinol-phosphate transaminase [Streptomyces sp. WAC06614]|uniref:histidinol-phosphate transaminase n=1 Tax=Streptomyces sp. WAC06614 TaxID=2487416 RepID=UPI0021AF10C2|nr:histidinol-phosphate transaminase [Streptomyces sp. WAC06614]
MSPSTRATPPTKGNPPVYQLNANENPYPPLPSVRAALEEAAGRAHRYPDRFHTEVTAALAARLDVPESHVVMGAGSCGVLQHLLHSLVRDGDEVAFAWPSFEAYPHLTAMNRGVAVTVPLQDETHDLDALADAIGPRTKVVLVCNPNNPTSTVVGRAALERFLDRVPAEVTVVLDEAYREFVTDLDSPDGIALYRDRPNLVVVRTFSKAYGLAGLRIGYAVAHEPLAAVIRSSATPFGVTAAAHTGAVASLAAEDELLERVELLVKERDRTATALRDLGLPVPHSEANFVWLPLGEDTEAFAAACTAAGVAVRAFPGEGIRLTIGTPEANTAALTAATSFARTVTVR